MEPDGWGNGAEAYRASLGASSACVSRPEVVGKVTAEDCAPRGVDHSGIHAPATCGFRSIADAGVTGARSDPGLQQ